MKIPRRLVATAHGASEAGLGIAEADWFVQHKNMWRDVYHAEGVEHYNF